MPSPAVIPSSWLPSWAAARGALASCAVWSLCAGLLLGCASALPTPARSAHRDSDFSEVPFPPPAIRGDKIPKRPSTASVWIDGEWRWQGRRWIWVSGTWLTPPEGARFARWDTRRDGTTLLYAPGIFFLPDGSTVEPDALREARRARPADVPCVPSAPGAPPNGPSPAVSSAASTVTLRGNGVRDGADPAAQVAGGETSTLYPPCAAEAP